MALRYDPTPPWKTYDVLLRGTDGRFSVDGPRPFVDQLTAGGSLPTQAIGKMWLVGVHGWPRARQLLRDTQGRPLIDRADALEPMIWILKCKPSCWRLYFHVYEGVYEYGERRVLYLYAKCKKRNERDDEDSRRARAVFNRVGGAGGSGIVEFPFPPRETV